MWPVTAEWLAALGASHGIRVSVDAIRDGEHLGSVPFEAAQLRITARNRVRRQLEMAAPEDLYPTDADDLLSPFGTELFVAYTVTGTDGEAVGPAVPVFLGGIDTVDRVRRSGGVAVTASGRFADLNAAQFVAPVTPSPGALVTSVIADLIAAVLPDVGVDDRTGAADTVPSGIVWERDRAAAIDELAASIGAEVVERPDGGFSIRAVPTTADPPAWTVTSGSGGTVVADQTAQGRDGVRNAWVVLGERPDGSLPVRAVVYDNDPMSPTRWDGPLRQRPGFWSSPLIRTVDQATVAGLARLARSRGLSRTRRVVTVPNPALDAGDVLVVVVDGEAEVHVVDDIALDLMPSGAGMTINTRSVELVES